MTADALGKDRQIGMVLLKPGFEAEYFDRPAIHSFGCVGHIQDCHQLPDGKYNFALKGFSRYKIVREIGDAPYRQAEVLLLKEINDRALEGHNDPIAQELAARLTAYCEKLTQIAREPKIADIPQCDRLSVFVDRMIMSLDLTPEQKQGYLEEQDVMKRADTLLEEIKLKTDLISLSHALSKKKVDPRMN